MTCTSSATCEGVSSSSLALSKLEAAEALGVSVDFLEQHVMNELRVVRRGRWRLIPIAEITRWMESNAQRTLGDG